MQDSDDDGQDPAQGEGAPVLEGIEARLDVLRDRADEPVPAFEQTLGALSPPIEIPDGSEDTAAADLGEPELERLSSNAKRIAAPPGYQEALDYRRLPVPSPIETAAVDPGELPEEPHLLKVFRGLLRGRERLVDDLRAALARASTGGDAGLNGLVANGARERIERLDRELNYWGSGRENGYPSFRASDLESLFEQARGQEHQDAFEHLFAWREIAHKLGPAKAVYARSVADRSLSQYVLGDQPYRLNAAALEAYARASLAREAKPEIFQRMLSMLEGGHPLAKLTPEQLDRASRNYARLTGEADLPRTVAELLYRLGH